MLFDFGNTVTMTLRKNITTTRHSPKHMTSEAKHTVLQPVTAPADLPPLTRGPHYTFLWKQRGLPVQGAVCTLQEIVHNRSTRVKVHVLGCGETVDADISSILGYRFQPGQQVLYQDVCETVAESLPSCDTVALKSGRLVSAEDLVLCVTKGQHVSAVHNSVSLVHVYTVLDVQPDGKVLGLVCDTYGNFNSRLFEPDQVWAVWTTFPRGTIFKVVPHHIEPFKLYRCDLDLTVSGNPSQIYGLTPTAEAFWMQTASFEPDTAHQDVVVGTVLTIPTDALRICSTQVGVETGVLNLNDALKHPGHPVVVVKIKDNLVKLEPVGTKVSMLTEYLTVQQLGPKVDSC